jgi:P4 family phage/plasmid primase-like protien
MIEPAISQTQKINLFKNLFRGRNDCYGEGKGLCTKEPLTDDVIKGHLTGNKRIGVYLLSGKSKNEVYFSVMDFDKEDNAPAEFSRLGDALEYYNSCKSYGINAWIEKSKTNGCYHVWHFFSEPVSALKIRRLMAQIISDTNIQRFEIFPKQDQTETYGNYINLPLFKTNLPKNTAFIDETNQPIKDQWLYLQKIIKNTSTNVDAIIEINGINLSNNGHKPTSETQEKWITEAMKGAGTGKRTDMLVRLISYYAKKKIPNDVILEMMLQWDKNNKPTLAENYGDNKIPDTVKDILSRYHDGGVETDSSEDTIEIEVEKSKKFEKCKYYHADENGKQTFSHGMLADELMTESKYICVSGTGVLYVYKDGVYAPISDAWIESESQKRLGYSSRTTRINEVVNYIKRASIINPNELNKHKHLINLENGMFDYKNKVLLNHNPDFFSTVRLPITYKQDIDNDQIMSWLTGILPTDSVKLALELFGYCMIPDCTFETAFMLLGSGSNGKSTFLTVLENFIGNENVSKIPLQELSDNRFKRADLLGKLVNLFADLDNRSMESTSYFKAIVSGDSIDCEKKHQDPFYFKPYSRLVFSANEIPGSFDRSSAFYRRWRILKFTKKFTGIEAKKGFADELSTKENLSALLNLALSELNLLFEQGYFTTPDTSNEELSSYVRMNDPVGTFIKESTMLIVDGFVERKDLYIHYLEYCSLNKTKVLPRNQVYDSIRALQSVSEKVADGKDYFCGIVLKSVDND